MLRCPVPVLHLASPLAGASQYIPLEVRTLHQGQYLHVRALREWLRLFRLRGVDFHLVSHPAQADGRALGQRLRHDLQYRDVFLLESGADQYGHRAALIVEQALCPESAASLLCKIV